ncbi:hypothetical protein JCM5350_005961 [Sporobolomyces pararoseus]
MPKRLKRSPTTSTSSSESSSDSNPSKEFLLTKEIVTLIIKLATDGKPNQLLNLALVSKVFKEIALEILYGELVIEGGWDQLKKYARYKNKSRKGKELVQQQVETKSFELKLETIYPVHLTKSLVTLHTVFNSFSTSLTCLSLSLPPTSHNPIPHLFSTTESESDNDQHQLSILSSLTELRSFKLEGGGSEIWFHDLIKLFSSWSKLRILELVCLVRGDCNKPLPLPSEAIIPRLEKLVISKTTLNGKMIQFLLSNQKESLKWLEIPLPGTTSNNHSHTSSEEREEEEEEEEIEGKLAWNAIQGLFDSNGKEGDVVGSSSNNVGGVGSKLEVLKLTDRFWETTCAKRRKEALKLKKKKEETANKLIKTSGGVGVGGGGTDKQKKKDTKVTGKGKSKKAQPQPDSDEDENDEIDELASDFGDDQQEAPAPPPPIVVFPPSPFLPILSSQNSLRSLLLTTAYLPSSPSSKSSKQLLPHLDNLVELTIEDTKQSGLREMVKKALLIKEGKSFKSLKRLVSVGIKKTKRKKASNTNPKGKGKVVATKGKGKKKIQESDSESDDEEEDELASDESDEEDKNEKMEPEESEESKRKKEMTKPELKFYEFCEKKGIEWRIQRDQ